MRQPLCLQTHMTKRVRSAAAAAVLCEPCGSIEFAAAATTVVSRDSFIHRRMMVLCGIEVLRELRW